MKSGLNYNDNEFMYLISQNQAILNDFSAFILNNILNYTAHILYL